MDAKYWCIVHGEEKNNCPGCVYEEVKREKTRIREEIKFLPKYNRTINGRIEFLIIEDDVLKILGEEVKNE